MKQRTVKSPWDGFAGDLFRRGYSFGLSAIQLIHVAKAIASHRHENDLEKAVFNGAHSPAILTLAGFAFELFLKSAILAKSGDTAEVKSIGHDLIAALDRAEECGIAVLESTRFSINIANRAHSIRGENKLFFRYGGGEQAAVETGDAIISSLNELLSQVAPLIDHPQASFDNFLVPFAPA